MKQLCGSTKFTERDLKSQLHKDLVCEDAVLAEKINQAFVSIMMDYSPLADSTRVSADDDDPIVVIEQSVARKLREVSTSRASGPDDTPNWVLKEYSGILAVPIANILKASFSEVSVPCVWKRADVSPLPKAPIVSDFIKDLRPISLNSTMSKITESFVIEKALKLVVLSHIDPGQFGFIPGFSTTFAVIPMFHRWLRTTDGTGVSVRTAPLDFRQAFDLVDHNILVLHTLGVKPTAINWIIDILKDRKQRVKLNGVYSDWLYVPTGVPQGLILALGYSWC